MRVGGQPKGNVPAPTLVFDAPTIEMGNVNGNKSLGTGGFLYVL
jgi:hypothetical protein